MSYTPICFQFSYLPHSTNGKCYITDAIMLIDESIYYCDNGIEISDSVQRLVFKVTNKKKLNGYYVAYIQEDKLIAIKRINDKGNEYEIHSANYETDFQKTRPSSDDPIWEALDYMQEQDCTQKKCTYCKEINSCGNYDCAKNWVCEECEFETL